MSAQGSRLEGDSHVVMSHLFSGLEPWFLLGFHEAQRRWRAHRQAGWYDQWIFWVRANHRIHFWCDEPRFLGSCNMGKSANLKLKFHGHLCCSPAIHVSPLCWHVQVHISFCWTAFEVFCTGPLLNSRRSSARLVPLDLRSDQDGCGLWLLMESLKSNSPRMLRTPSPRELVSPWLHTTFGNTLTT